jgi:hypothetical protein
MLFHISTLHSSRSARRWLAISLLGLSSAAYAGEAARIVFVSGQVHAGERALAIGDAVQEGDEIVTGKQGTTYLKTVDNGLLILRPSSRARIVTYHVDKDNPANTRIKFELLSGVARSVSGDAVKLARQNFRFNTPVAAIGVRGTDFTVSTDNETSRVTVISGAIVVSGFGGACMPGGSGPCEQPASRELAASQAGQMLQVRKGQPAPQLLSTSGSALAPDVVAPPRVEEPVGKATGTPVTGEISLDPKKSENLITQIAVRTNNNTQQPPAVAPPTEVLPEAPPVVVVPPVVTPIEPPPVVVVPPVVQSQIIWGRWQQIANSPAVINTVEVAAAGAQEIARNGNYALFRTPGENWKSPAEGSIGFSLAQSEAFVTNESTRVSTAATLENGKLNVDFGKAAFTTSFDLQSSTGVYPLRAAGTVAKDGLLTGNLQFGQAATTNMAVTGVLSNENGGSAAYIFSSRLDEKRVVNGATYWRK